MSKPDRVAPRPPELPAPWHTPERAALLTATFGELRQLLAEADPQAWSGTAE